jgi:hypothetical protein
MSCLWDAVFIQVLDRADPLTLNLSGTPYTFSISLLPILHLISDGRSPDVMG